MNKVIRITPISLIFASGCLFVVLFTHYLNINNTVTTVDSNAMQLFPSTCIATDQRPGCG